MNEKKISQYLSFILRHKPEEIGLTLDVEGWANINELINKSQPIEERILTKEIIQQIVQNSDKKRFQLSDNKLNIRAIQGHSIPLINRTFIKQTPPDFLYHGTAQRFYDSIITQGLIAKERHYVHLTEHINTANAVGIRYGKPVILIIHAIEMYNNGFIFFKTENDVWLINNVPIEYIGKSCSVEGSSSLHVHN